jgi:cytidylate kinase
MAVITIARQLGAGGEAVAHRLADVLGWRLLDRALVERIAEELEVAPEQVEACNERVENFVERLGAYLSEGFPEMMAGGALPPVSPETTARAARRIVAAVADEGPAVIVGHGAQCILQGHADALHVLVHAPLDYRVGRARDHFGLDERAAAERVKQSDADRKRYIREHFGRDWLDPALYHLCVDSARFGVDGAAELIQDAAARVFGQAGIASR